MSTNAINKTLQYTYPAAVFSAVLASAGLNLVHAQGSEYQFFLQNPQIDPHHRTIASAEIKSCTVADRIWQINHPGKCPEDSKDNDAIQALQMEDTRQFVSNNRDPSGPTTN